MGYIPLARQRDFLGVAAVSAASIDSLDTIGIYPLVASSPSRKGVPHVLRELWQTTQAARTLLP